MAARSSVAVLFETPNYKETMRAIGGVQVALDKLAESAANAASKTTRAHIQLLRTTAKENDRVLRDGVKSTDKAEREKLSILNRAHTEALREDSRREKEKTRIVDRHEKERMRLRINTINREMRERERADREMARSQQRAAREHESRIRSMSGSAGHIVGRSFSAVGRAAGVVAGLGGGFAVADALRTGMRNEAIAGQLVRSAASNKAGYTRADVVGKAHAASLGTGIEVEQINTGLDAFIQKSGDLDAGVGMLEELAKVSAVTGASMESLGLTAGDLFMKLGNIKDTKDVIRAYAGYGKAGALDIRGLGEYGPRLSASAGMYAGNAAQNVKRMGILGQIAMAQGTAGEASIATEAAMSLGMDIKDRSAKFAGRDINIWADKTHTTLLPIEQILTQALNKTKGGANGAMLDLFGRRSFAAVAGVESIYNKGGGFRGGGANAVMAEFAKYGNQELTDEQVRVGVIHKLTENESKLTIATEKFHAAINDKLLPRMPQLVDEITKLIPRVAQLAEFLSRDIWHGVGGIVGAVIAAEIGNAAIGSIFEKAMLSALGGGTTGPGGKVSFSGAGGKLGAGVDILAAVAGGFTVGKLIVEQMITPSVAASERGSTSARIIAQNVDSVTWALRNKKITPEQALAKLNEFNADTQRRSTVIGGESNEALAEKRAFGREARDGLDNALAELTRAFVNASQKIGNVNIPEWAGRHDGNASPGSPARTGESSVPDWAGRY